MPTFPDPAQPAQYPRSLAGLQQVQVNAVSTQDVRPEAVAEAEDYNFLARNLVAQIEDIRAFIVAFGLDPDDTDNMETTAANILARIAAAGGPGGGGASLVNGSFLGTTYTPSFSLTAGETIDTVTFLADLLDPSNDIRSPNLGIIIPSVDVVTETIDLVDDPDGILATAPIFVDVVQIAVPLIRGIRVVGIISGPEDGDSAEVTFTINGITNRLKFNYQSTGRP